MPFSSEAESRFQQRQSFSKTRRQFWRITKAFFASERRRKARGLLTMLFTLSIASVGITVLTSYAARDVMTAIEKKNAHAWWGAMGRYLGSFVIAMLTDVHYRWAEQSLGLLWREWMAQHLIKRYFNNRAYYRLRGSENIDNPDQRISEDVRNFTTDTLSYTLMALSSVMTLIGFIGVLWSISGTLVSVAFVYATAGTFMCVRIGRRLVRMHYDKYQREADFRYGLVRVRDNAESIAFYRGEKREHLDLVRRLGNVVSNMRSIIHWNRTLGFFRNSYNYLALLLPIIIVAPLFMEGKIQFGAVTQSIDAFAQVLGALALITSNFEGLSSYLAGVQRLGSLWDDLDDFDADELRVATESAQQLEQEGRHVRLNQLTVRTPDRTKTLVTDLTLELKEGQSLIIMGASGTGKSSVLRTIAGLWPGGSGTIERPLLRDLMFLPQRPYMVLGNLRDQFLYPFPDRGLSDQRIQEIVQIVNLTDVLDRVNGDFNRVIDWGNVLSLGEQQRVAFARLLARRPRFAFLDEASSALDEDNQSLLYQLIRESGMGFVSVGHRRTLVPFHERILHLKTSGNWELRDTSGSEPH